MVQCLGKVMGTAFGDSWGGGVGGVARKRSEKTVFIMNTDTRFGLTAHSLLLEPSRRKSMSFCLRNVFYKEGVQKLLLSWKTRIHY